MAFTAGDKFRRQKIGGVPIAVWSLGKNKRDDGGCYDPAHAKDDICSWH